MQDGVFAGGSAEFWSTDLGSTPQTREQSSPIMLVYAQQTARRRSLSEDVCDFMRLQDLCKCIIMTYNILMPHSSPGLDKLRPGGQIHPVKLMTP